MHLVDQSSLQVLPDRRRSAANTHILSARRFLRPLQRRMNSVRHKMKCRPALHLEGRSRMMRQHKDRTVIRRVLAPPAFPILVPWSAPGGEHIPPENPCPNSFHSSRSKIVVQTVFSVPIPVHSLKGARWKKPPMQIKPAFP